MSTALGHTCAQPAADEPSAAEKLESAWDALGSEKADLADEAIAALARSPDVALKIAQQRLALLVKDNGRGVLELIKALDDDQYTAREDAQEQLSALGLLAEAELRRAAATKLTLEAKSRVQLLLADLPGPFARSVHERRWIRLARLLKAIDTPESRLLFKVIEPGSRALIVDARVPPLFELLDSSSAEDRAGAALSLIELRAVALPVLPRLIELLSENEPRVQIGNLSQSVGAHVEGALPQFGRAAVEPLIAALQHSDVQVRARAATILGILQDERAIEPLVKLLSDAEYPPRSSAASAVARFGPRAVDPLIEALGKQDSQVRCQVAYSLGKIGDARAVEPLARVLGDDNKILREFALESLLKFGPAAMDAFIASLQSDNVYLRSDGKLRARIVAALGMIQHAKVVEPLLAALSDEHEEVRCAAVYWLSLQGAEAEPDARLAQLLASALRDTSSTVRTAAADSLGHLAWFDTDVERTGVVELLIEALDDPTLEVRRAAIQALGNWRAQQAVDVLLRLLDDKSLRVVAAEALGQIGDTRAAAPLRNYLAEKDQRVIRALGRLKDRESVEALVVLCKDSDTRIRDAAIEALGVIRDRRAVEPLIALLGGDTELLRVVARALGEIKDPRAVQPLIDISRKQAAVIEFRRSAFDAEINPLDDPVAWPLFQLGLPTIEPLAKALSDPCQPLQEVAAAVLYNLAAQGDVDDKDMRPAIEPLAAALGDPSEAVRKYAALTLGRLKDPRAAEGLLDVITANTASHERLNAAGDLGSLRAPQTLPPLLDLLKSERPGVRCAAATALGLLRDERAEKPLLAALRDADPTVRSAAAHALAGFKSDSAVESLMALLGDKEAEVRCMAAASLGRLGDRRASDPLAAIGGDPDFSVQIAAGIALVRLDDARGTPIVARCLADKSRKRREVAVTAVALSFAAKEALVPPLIVALGDPSIRVRLYAASALGHIGTPAAIDALLARLSDRENLRAILQALSQTRADRALQVLIGHMGDPDAAIRAVAARVIGKFGDDRVLRALLTHVADPSAEVRVAVISALTMLKSPAATGQLTAALQDDDPQVRVYAKRALSRLVQ